MTALTTPSEFMTASAWYAYDKIARGGQYEFAKPLPGYRFDHVYPDGSIGDYKDSPIRRGRCYKSTRQGPYHWQLNLNPLGFNPPALERCRDCTCGYRMARSVWLLMRYMYNMELLEAAGKLPAYSNQRSLGHGQQLGRRASSIVLSRVHGSGAAEKGDDDDNPGTIRVAKTQLVEVFLPTEHQGNPVPDSLAQKIRDRYKVTVRRVPGTLYNYKPTNLDPPMPDEWPNFVKTANFNLQAARNGTLEL